MKTIVINQKYKVNFLYQEVENLSTGLTRKIEPRLVTLLQVLVEHKGDTVTREKLIDHIWGTYGNGNEYLTHAVCLLRTLMDKSVIKTVAKKGYALNADVVYTSFSKESMVRYLTFKRVAAILGVLFFLKMLIFPHH